MVFFVPRGGGACPRFAVTPLQGPSSGPFVPPLVTQALPPTPHSVLAMHDIGKPGLPGFPNAVVCTFSAERSTGSPLLAGRRHLKRWRRRVQPVEPCTAAAAAPRRTPPGPNMTAAAHPAPIPPSHCAIHTCWLPCPCCLPLAMDYTSCLRYFSQDPHAQSSSSGAPSSLHRTYCTRGPSPATASPLQKALCTERHPRTSAPTRSAFPACLSTLRHSLPTPSPKARRAHEDCQLACRFAGRGAGGRRPALGRCSARRSWAVRRWRRNGGVIVICPQGQQLVLWPAVCAPRRRHAHGPHAAAAGGRVPVAAAVAIAVGVGEQLAWRAPPQCHAVRRPRPAAAARVAVAAAAAMAVAQIGRAHV